MTTPSAPSVALRYAAARVAAVKIPDPYNMTKAEFLNPRPPKARSGYQLLYHTTSNDAARDIARNGLLTRYSKSPPKGTIWASTEPDDFYGKGRRSALITFQVPKRGTPADQDPYNGVAWDMGNSVVIARDIAPEDIVDIDLYYGTDVGGGRLSWFRGGSGYAETYWDEWFGPRQKGKTASLTAKIPASVLYNKGRGGWEYGLGGFADWPSFRKKPKREQVAWAKEFVGSGGQIREPVDISVYSDGGVKFEDGHHRVIAGALLDLDIPVRVRFINFDKELWPDLLTLLKAGYTRRQYNPQDWKLKGSGVPPLDVVRRGPDAADEWIMSNERVKTASGYGEGHMPSNEGPPAHDLLEDGEGFAPPDILDNPHYYTAFKSQLRSFWPTILKAQGKPGARIKVYRALPSKKNEFNRGDWVTLSYEYAKDHADRGNVSGDDAHVIEATVPASTVRWDGDDLMEWGYFGPTVTGKSRTASTRKTAARPLRLDRSAVNRLLDDLYEQVERSSSGRSRRELGYGWLAESKFTVTTPKGDRREVIVELNTVPMKPSFRGVVVKGGYGYIKGKDDLMVSLTLNGSLTPDQFLNRRHTEKEIRAAMMHELTHASEVKGTLADLKVTRVYDYQDEPHPYHNDPFEVRAWMRQVYEEIREDPRAGVVPIEVLLENNRWWKQAEPHLTRKSRNRILKGLVTAFEDDGIEVRPTRKTAARPIRLPTREIKTLAKRLAQRLYQYGLPKPGRVTAQEYLPLTNVKGDEVVVEILLTGSPGRNRDPFGSKLLNGGFIKRRPEGPLMRVFVNPHLDPRTFEMRPRRIVEDELYGLLAHELTHAADIWSGKGSVGDLSGSRDDLKKHHHNHPAEVKSLMRDVVTNLDDGDTVREFMGYGMDFNTALREALKDTKWPDIEPYLTPRNKKTILKGVYTFLQDQGLDEVAR